MTVVAIVPARGGSKGIPRKNLKPVAGKPLIEHTLEQALSVEAIDRVIVSTDDEEIREVAARAGAEVILRPAEISGDEEPTESALNHVLGELRREKNVPDAVVLLQATSPNRTAKDIRNAFETFEAEESDSLFSACPLHGFVWRLSDSGADSLSYDFMERPRRQEAPRDVVENGSIYIFKPWVLEEHGNRLGGKISVHLMGSESYFQIDEPADIKIVSKLMPDEVQSWRARRKQLASVRLLVLDFDGVLTDNAVWVDGDGRETVRCSRGDGLALRDLKQAGVEVHVLSSETNPVVAARCKKLDLDHHQSLRSKIAALQELAETKKVGRDDIAYVGNDVNDIECLRWAGLGITVQDGHPSARRYASLVTRATGGQGAVREVCEWILATKGISDEERSENW